MAGLAPRIDDMVDAAGDLDYDFNGPAKTCERPEAIKVVLPLRD